MKRILVILFFLIIPFLKVTPVFAATPTPTPINTTTITATPTPNLPSNTNPQPNLWEMFWRWLFGLFVKTDYNIASRQLSDINSDMSDYGDKNDSSFQEKHSFAGSRSSDSSSQTCYKGNVIKKVILDTVGYPNTSLSKICFDSSNNCIVKPLNLSTQDIANQQLTNCADKTIKDLAHYFVQLQQQFYCTSDSNQLIAIGQDVIDKVNQAFSTPIPQTELNCYQQIYDDFYLTPKETTDNNEENTKKIIQTPISDKDQTNGSSQEIQNQLNRNFIPEGSKWSGLNSLRPEAW